MKYNLLPKSQGYSFHIKGDGAYLISVFDCCIPENVLLHASVKERCIKMRFRQQYVRVETLVCKKASDSSI